MYNFHIKDDKSMHNKTKQNTNYNSVNISNMLFTDLTLKGPPLK